MAKGHGSQCGFCTPGIVMSMYNLLKINPCPSEHDIEEAFDGNLCRCTGYRPILESTKSFAKVSVDNKSCDKKDGKKRSDKCHQLTDFMAFKDYDSNCDLPFPAKITEKTYKISALLLDGESFWFEASSIEEILFVKQMFPNSKMIGGNTEIGIDIKFRASDYKHFISYNNISELRNLSVTQESGKRVLEIGLGITLTDLIQGLKELKSNNQCKKYEFSLLDAFLSNLRWFASNQIRNFATLAGNVINASPISDLNPILLASNATITLLSERNGLRSVSMRNFYLAYKKLNMEPDEIAVKLTIPLPENNLEIYKAYKQCKRKDDDIATVNGCFRIKLQKDENNVFSISDLDLSYGGLAHLTLYLENVNKKSKGLEFGKEFSLKLIEDLILSDINLPYTVVGGLATYRRTLAISFFNRFWYQVIKELNKSYSYAFKVENNLLNNIDEIERGLSSSVVDIGIRNWDVIGSPLPNVSSINQTTGVAQFTDDIPTHKDELQIALVLSTISHGLIKNIDASKAFEIEGVRGFLSYKDIGAHNLFGCNDKDEEYLASSEVKFYGQIIGAIVAKSKEIAKKAARLVKIDYEALDTVITIEEAIEKNSFYDGHELELQNGVISDETFDLSRENSSADKVIEGKVRIGGQEHFYMETQSCLVIPKPEDDQFEVFASSQNLRDVQTEIARVLSVPQNKIVCKVKRVGGAFGGKETRATPFAVITALAAQKFRKAARLVLERDVDMLISGNRHPFLAEYKLRVTKDGYFKAFDLNLFNNAGVSLDMSLEVMQQCAYKIDSAYKIPNIRIRGKLARTNLASNTA